MAITEEARHQLYKRLEDLLGREEAATLMEHLPPVGWADVATKRDLDHVVALMDARFDHQAAATKANIENLGNVLRVEIANGQRQLVFAMLAANSTIAALAFGAARLV